MIPLDALTQLLIAIGLVGNNSIAGKKSFAKIQIDVRSQAFGSLRRLPIDMARRLLGVRYLGSTHAKVELFDRKWSLLFQGWSRRNDVQGRTATKLVFKEDKSMLVLSRKEGEKLVIGDNITLVISKIAGNRVTVGIEAPADVKIVRGELREGELKEGESNDKEAQGPKLVPLRRAATVTIDLNPDDLSDIETASFQLSRYEREQQATVKKTAI